MKNTKVNLLASGDHQIEHATKSVAIVGGGKVAVKNAAGEWFNASNLRKNKKGIYETKDWRKV